MWISRFLFIFVIFLGISLSAEAGSCKIKSEHILFLKGDTDAKMLECVREIDLTEVDTILLKSQGGSVENALKIGSVIAPLNAKMIVKDYCNSSCANYFLPLAKSVTVEAEAELMLHGSIDPAIIQEAEPKDRIRLQKVVSEQHIYAQKHGIHRGWLLYRTDYARGSKAVDLYVLGEFGWLDRNDPVGFFQVEQRFFESCFPEIPITFEKPTLISLANKKEKLRDKLLKKGLRPTGNWICRGAFDPNWQGYDDPVFIEGQTK